MDQSYEGDVSRTLRRHLFISSGVIVLAAAALCALGAHERAEAPARGGFDGLLSMAAGLSEGLRTLAIGSAIVVVAVFYLLLSSLLVTLLRRRKHTLLKAHAATLASVLVWFALGTWSNARERESDALARRTKQELELRECRAKRRAAVMVHSYWPTVVDAGGFPVVDRSSETREVSVGISEHSFCKPTHDAVRLRLNDARWSLAPTDAVSLQTLTDTREKRDSPWRIRTTDAPAPPRPIDFLVEVHDPEAGWTPLEVVSN